MGVLALAAVLLITGTLRGVGPLQRAQGAGADVMRPFEIVAHKVASPFVDTYDYFSGLFSAKSENKKLRKELQQAQELASQNAAAAAEIVDLRKALRYKGPKQYPNDFTGVFTAVTSRAYPDPASAITIAAGSSSSVRKNDPVVSPDGKLVGTVTEVSGDSSRVTLLTDPSSAASAVDINSPKAQGLVRASVNARGGISVYVDRVPKSAKVSKDDEIDTAGWHYRDISSLYPPGIPIGRVISVGLNDVNETAQIQIELYADLSSLQNVIVVIPKSRVAAK